MPLAFEADELLQEIVPKHRINFLGVLNEKVREAIKKRGDWWRITPLPKSPEEMKQMIRESRISLGGAEIYYYSKTTGVRYLTCREFAELGKPGRCRAPRSSSGDSGNLAPKSTRTVSPEIAFFAAGRIVLKSRFRRLRFPQDGRRLACGTSSRSLKERFIDAVEPELRQDDVEAGRMAKRHGCRLARARRRNASPRKRCSA